MRRAPESLFIVPGMVYNRSLHKIYTKLVGRGGGGSAPPAGPAPAEKVGDPSRNFVGQRAGRRHQGRAAGPLVNHAGVYRAPPPDAPHHEPPHRSCIHSRLMPRAHHRYLYPRDRGGEGLDPSCPPRVRNRRARLIGRKGGANLLRALQGPNAKKWGMRRAARGAQRSSRMLSTDFVLARTNSSSTTRPLYRVPIWGIEPRSWGAAIP